MKITNIWYCFVTGIRYLFSNKLMTLASIVVLTACMFILGSFWAVMETVDYNVDQLAQENEIVVFLDETLDEPGMREVGEKIIVLHNVATCHYTSREEALEEYKGQFPEQADLFEDLPADALRASYTISVKDISLYNETIYQLEQIHGIARIRDLQETVDGLLHIGGVIKTISYWLMGLLLLAALFLIVNTVKLAGFLNRKQISLMRYVGATKGFIRFPFIVQGVIMGVIAASIGFLLEWYFYGEIVKSLSVSFISFMPFSAMAPVMYAVFLGTGLFVGIFGSSFSIRRYMEV